MSATSGADFQSGADIQRSLRFLLLAPGSFRPCPRWLRGGIAEKVRCSVGLCRTELLRRLKVFVDRTYSTHIAKTSLTLGREEFPGGKRCRGRYRVWSKNDCDLSCWPVGRQGQFHWEKRRWDVSCALRGQRVGLEPISNRVLVYFCSTPLRELDPQHRRRPTQRARYSL